MDARQNYNRSTSPSADRQTGEFYLGTNEETSPGIDISETGVIVGHDKFDAMQTAPVEPQ